ncbi:hard surface induced protein [Phlyctema vagabunda]|uniref:Hard surface induced protein n=1 Tax=Phlyctema vagabunda TaxID=108571 RepID=A0ABR4PIJ4_9HELO
MERQLRSLVSSFIPSRISNNDYALLTTSEQSSPASSITASKADALTRAKISLQQFAFFLLPSPVQRRLRPALFKPQRLYPTSYLDGLRGVASLFVYFCHYTEGNVGWYTNSYGLAGPDDHVHSSPVQLPFLRVLYSGRPMVHIFFVISGFVLSYKPLKLARARNYGSLHTTLSSSVFRRGLRLFLPTTASTFMVMIFIRLGWMGSPLPTFWAQFWDWKNAVWRITYSWNWDITQLLPYDVHLWTIPIEMGHSLLLFITICGLSRCKTWLRLSFLFAIMVYCLRCQHWAAFEFLGGMLVAEVGLIQDARAERDANKEDSGSRSSSKWWTLFWMANFVTAMFIAGWPNNGADQTPGFRYLVPLTPDPFYTTGGDVISFFWYALGSMQVVIACQQLPILQRLFTTSLAQYLANISYALYLMHGPILDVLAHRWMPYVWWVAGGGDNMWSRLIAWFGGIVILGIPIVWAADIFWRGVDTPCVSFAKWLEGACVVKED